MQENLNQLARELRKETCPHRVIDEVARRIAAEAPPPGRLRYALPVAMAALLALGGLIVHRRWAGGNAGQTSQLVEQRAAGRAQTLRQAGGALVLIGTVLRDAGAHSETVISDRALPPLRKGLETSWNKIIRQTEL